MFKRFLLGTAGVLVAASMASTAANALLIDSFTDALENDVTGDGDGFVIDFTTGSPVFDRSVQALGTILGGDRELVLEKTSGGGLVNAKVVSPGVFTHNNNAGTAGTSLLRWDGAGGGDGLDMGLTDGAGGIDVTEAGANNGVGLRVITADLSNMSSVRLRLYTTATQYSELSLTIPVVNVFPLGNSPFSALFTFTDILTLGTQGGDGDADLTDIRAIELLATGNDAFDFSVDFFETTNITDVPEPASMALIGAGLVGLGGMARRRKAAER